MGSLFADIRHAFRMLLKSPGFTIVSVSALALGIGANTAIFTVIDSVLLEPLPYPGSDRIMSVVRSFKNGDGESTSLPKYFAWRRNGVFESMTVYDFAGPGLNLSGGDRPEQVKAIHVSAEFFRVFGVSPVAGRSFTAEEDQPGGPHAAVISSGIWKSRLGGDLRLLGRTISLNGDPYTVVGIMPPGFTTDPPADIWIPLQADPNSANQGHYLRTAARLKPGVTVAAAQARMKVLGDRFRRANPKAMNDTESVAVVPLQELTVRGIRPALLILLGAVGFVLLIACANVANLLLARASERQREIAIRTAIGAGRARIIRQLLTESVLLAAIGGALGCFAGIAGLRALLAVNPGNIPRLGGADGGAPVIELNWHVLAFALGVCLVTAIVFGILPALQISRFNLNSTLKESGGRAGTGLKHNRTRGLLVISETALAMVLLTGAGLLLQTFNQLHNVKPGFDPRHVLTMRASLAGGKYMKTAAVDNFTRQVVQRIEALPGVHAAASTLLLPAEGSIDMTFEIAGKQAAKAGEPNGDEQIVYTTPHYFPAFKIPLLRGRAIEERDSGSSAPVMVISDSFAKKYFPNEEPLGHIVTIGRGGGPEMEDGPRQIVGVVGDVRQNGLNRPVTPLMYLPASQMRDSLTKLASAVIPLTWIVRTAGDPWALSAAIQREILAVDGQMPVSKVSTMEQVLGSAMNRQNFNMLLLTVFAGIALLLASIGIYGLMAYSVEQRRHEIGIRMALGAGTNDMLRLTLMQGMRLTLAGIAIGSVAAFALTRLLSAMLYGVQPTDPATFAGVAGGLSLVALLACYVPARRAARVDPVIALRYE